LAAEDGQLTAQHQQLAQPATICYSRARVKLEIDGVTARRYSTNRILEPFTRYGDILH
jgi:hypothetical protein